MNMIANLAMQSPSGLGSLPSNIVANPRGDVKAITTRSGVAYDGPTIPPTPSPLLKEVERKTEVTKDKVQTISSQSTTHVQPPVVQDPISKPEVAPKPNPKPSIPYPSRLNDQKLSEKANNQMLKFLQIFQRLHFDISFADALLYMPKFASTFKSLLSNKEKLFELASTPLNENCSPVLLKKLPEKLRDPDKFLILCDFPDLDECLALDDLGASINLMPLSSHVAHDLGSTKFTIEERRFRIQRNLNNSISAQLWKDSAAKYILNAASGNIVNVAYILVMLVRINAAKVKQLQRKSELRGSFVSFREMITSQFQGKLWLYDEVHYDVDPRVPLILGRPFLRTAQSLIDVHGEEMTLRVDDEAITFKVGHTSIYSYNYYDETLHQVNVIDVACKEYAQEVLGFSDSSTSGNPTPSDPIIASSSPSFTSFEGGDFILGEIESCLSKDSIPLGIDDVDFDPKGDIRLLEKLLNEDPSPTPPQMKNDDLRQVDVTMTKPSIEEPPKLELKDLPSHLEYAFLEGTDKLPVIIFKELEDEEKAALLKVLKSHKRAIAWKISDIKGIDLSFCTYKILMEDDFKPTVQHQRRVNPKIHEVIKKEVIKLLDAKLLPPYL
ncbi:hypothetical protein Tco_0820508 [Tanacetum coccineum]|uniref:Reverse transcriptase domain-containing protein n=1 Tax=Tanacetum coccineum TaxID=301880 RepID=A0ABQ5ADX2_9ASTR